jgi:hypothetical protein
MNNCFEPKSRPHFSTIRKAPVAVLTLFSSPTALLSGHLLHMTQQKLSQKIQVFGRLNRELRSDRQINLFCKSSRPSHMSKGIRRGGLTPRPLPPISPHSPNPLQLPFLIPCGNIHPTFIQVEFSHLFEPLYLVAETM